MTGSMPRKMDMALQKDSETYYQQPALTKAEAMLINSTKLIMTRMAPSLTALVGPCQFCPTCATTCLLKKSPSIFLSQSGQKFSGAAYTEIKTWYLQLILPLQGLNASMPQ